MTDSQVSNVSQPTTTTASTLPTTAPTTVVVQNDAKQQEAARRRVENQSIQGGCKCKDGCQNDFCPASMKTEGVTMYYASVPIVSTVKTSPENVCLQPVIIPARLLSING